MICNITSVSSQDGDVIGVNRPDPEMTEVALPERFLSEFFLGRCSYSHKFACSSPESEYTDLNIWDRSLSMDQLVKWTTCQ